MSAALKTGFAFHSQHCRLVQLNTGIQIQAPVADLLQQSKLQMRQTSGPTMQSAAWRYLLDFRSPHAAWADLGFSSIAGSYATASTSLKPMNVRVLMYRWCGGWQRIQAGPVCPRGQWGEHLTERNVCQKPPETTADDTIDTSPPNWHVL